MKNSFDTLAIMQYYLHVFRFVYCNTIYMCFDLYIAILFTCVSICILQYYLQVFRFLN